MKRNKKEILISGILIVCISVFEVYTDEIFDNKNIGTLTKSDSPLFFWVSVIALFVLGGAMILSSIFPLKNKSEKHGGNTNKR